MLRPVLLASLVTSLAAASAFAEAASKSDVRRGKVSPPPQAETSAAKGPDVDGKAREQVVGAFAAVVEEVAEKDGETVAEDAARDVAQDAVRPSPGTPLFGDYTLEFIVIPLYTQSPDAGPTALGAGSMYVHDGKTRPYKAWLSFIGSGSWAGVFSAISYLEWVRPFDAPLRLLVSAGYQTTLAGHYCGEGSQVTCDEREALLAGDSYAPAGSSREDFVRRYYRYRYHGPTATATLRWAVKNLPHRVEAVVGGRGYYYLPGAFGFNGLDPGPYPGSKYAQAFPDGEGGALNIVEAGLMLDNRDQESGPTRGYWIEGSMRSASGLTLSDWNFGGVNLTARGYLPLRKGGALVLAQRAIFDGIVGEAPTYELQRIGGSWAYSAFGGQNIGRGIREARVLGKVKIISQTELRGRLYRWKWFGVPFDLGAAGFLDVGYVAADWRRVGREAVNVQWGFGGGLRLKVMQNLLFRAEVGFSPTERFQPQIYIWPSYPF